MVRQLLRLRIGSARHRPETQTAGRCALDRSSLHDFNLCWISALIALPAIGFAGRPFFKSAWGAVKRGTTNMDVPISLGVIIAAALSLYETWVGGAHAWFDGALMLLTFLLAGRVLDAMMRDKARSGVEALVNQAARGAQVLREDGKLAYVAAEDLQPGMVMRVATGERLAADGEIISGRSAFDQSLLTGESHPVALGKGDEAEDKAEMELSEEKVGTVTKHDDQAQDELVQKVGAAARADVEAYWFKVARNRFETPLWSPSGRLLWRPSCWAAAWGC